MTSLFPELLSDSQFSPCNSVWSTHNAYLSGMIVTISYISLEASNKVIEILLPTFKERGDYAGMALPGLKTEETMRA